MQLKGKCIVLYYVCKRILKMCTLCRKETQVQVKEDRTDKEKEKTVVTEVEEINHTGYERVYLPETDTSEDDDSDMDSDSSDDF